VGKTSLLRAGVAWRLHRLADDMFAKGRPVRSIPVVFGSWKDDPTTELADAVDAAVRPYLGDGGTLARADGPLDAAVEAAADTVNAGLLIMLDQFEEYFLYRTREPVPGRFADELARCVNRTDLRANFVIAVREDAYAEVGDLFKGRITNVYGNFLHIDYLDRAAAKKAIRGPVEVYNRQPGVIQPVTVQDELVEAVLDEVRAWDEPAAAGNGGRDRIATPLLQLVMQRVWDTERAEGSAELRLSTLTRLRGVRMIVDDHLGKALGSLNGAEREAAIDMFDHLVTPSGGKIAESVSDLAKRTGHAEDQVDGMLRKLDNERILRPVPAAPGQDPVRSRRYEIFHDVLASPINRAIAAREEQRRVRRVRRLAALAVALLVIVSAVAAVFGYLLNSANTQKLTAESRELAADADLNVARDPELSTSLALQALQLRSTSQAEDALRAALPGLQVLRTFHDGSPVAAAAFDPADPNKVVSVDSSGVAWIWDVRTGRRLERLSYGDYATTGRASAVAYNPAGTLVAVGYQDSSIVVIFDTHTGRIYKKTASVHGSVVDLEFVGNTGKLAIAGGDLALWQYDTAACCDDLHLPGQVGFALIANPHNPTEFVAATPVGLFLLTIDHSGKPHKVLLSSQLNGAQFSRDGSEIVATNSDGSVVIYRVATRKVVATFSAYGTVAQDAAFSPDGRQIVVGYQDGTARVWDIASKLQLTLLAGHTGLISSVQFSPDGREILTGSMDGTIRVWYAEPRELRTEFTVPVSGSSYLDQVAYVSDRIITADYVGDAFVYSASGKLQTTIKAGTEGTQGSWSWNRAGTKIMVVANHGAQSVGVGELWHATGSGLTLQRTFRYSNTGVDNAVISPDGSHVAIVVDDNSLNSINSFTNKALIIDVRNTDTGRLVRTLRAVKSIQAVAFNPNGRQIVGIDAAGQIEAWNGTATHPRVLGSPGSSFATVSFNQSGSEFVVASNGGAISVWNARDGRAVTTINACPAPADAVFSPDGSKLVVACGDGTVRVFDADDGRPLTVIQATSAGAVRDAGFSPDGTSIVAVTDVNTGEIQIWNAELATSSLPALERIAGQRVGDKLTAAQQQYLSGASG
jgi:WD40 repeat protein